MTWIVRLTRCLALFFILGFAAVALVIAAEPIRLDLDLPEQRLDVSLDLLAKTSGVAIVAPQDLTAGRTAPSVSGRLTLEEALERLLADSGLSFRLSEGGEVIVEAVHAEEITVLGSRRPEAPLASVPASISLVGEEEIRTERALGSRIEEVLAHRIPGFNPTNGGVRQIRGRTAQVFVNGVPVNEQLRASSGSDLNLLLPDQLALIEVSRGASSAYGFGAPGGIIALSTPRAESSELTARTVLSTSVNPHSSSGSNRSMLYQSVSRVVNERFDYHLGGAVTFDGLERDPDGELALGFDNAALVTNGTEWVTSLDLSVGVDFAERGRLRLLSTYNKVDFDERYTAAPGVYGGEWGSLDLQPEGGRSDRTAHTVNLSWEDENLWGQAARLEVFSARTDSLVLQDFGELVWDDQHNDYDGFRSSLSRGLPLGAREGALTAGVDGFRNRYFRPVTSVESGELVTYFSPDVTLESLAAFVQLDAPVTERLVLSGGARHERYGGKVETTTGPLAITGGDIESFDLTLLNAALSLKWTPDVESYLSYTQGAEISQLGRAAREVTAADQVDPRPAKSNQYELGLRRTWEAGRLGAAAFYTESKLLSALFCDGLTPCVPLREPREIWGLELEGEWTLASQWTLEGVASWQDGVREVEGDERRIGSSDVPPLLVTTGLRYASKSGPWNGLFQLNYRGERDPFGSSIEYGEGAVDDVVLVNLVAGYETGFGLVRLGVENLLNEEYASIVAAASNSEWLWLPEEGTRLTLSYAKTW
jgi:iron complex outermembrane receptor protein